MWAKYYSNELTEREQYYFEVDDFRKYFKSISLYKKLDGYNAKIVVPKKYGVGISGVYIDSLWMNKEDRVKFNFYGNNLTKENQKLFFQVISTIKFEKKISN